MADRIQFESRAFQSHYPFTAVAFRTPSTVSKKLVKSIHRFSKSRAPNKTLRNLKEEIDKELFEYFKNDDYLTIGYLKEVGLSITHIEKGHTKDDFNILMRYPLRVMLAPYQKTGYIPLIFQTGRMPVLLVSHVYKEEENVHGIASWKSPIYAAPLGFRYSLENFENIIDSLDMIKEYTASDVWDVYRRLDVPWYFPPSV